MTPGGKGSPKRPREMPAGAGKCAVLSMGAHRAVIVFSEDRAPETCNRIWRSLPLQGPLSHAKFAGEELVFMIPLVMDAECLKATIEPGDVLYYPVQQTVCLFYGEAIEPFGPGPFPFIGRILEGWSALKEMARRVRRSGGGWAELRRLQTARGARR